MPSAKPSLMAMAQEAKASKNSAKPKKGTKAIPAARNFKSTEFVQESDDEGADNNEVSEDESSSEDDESLPDDLTKVKTKDTGKLPPPSGSSSSSENESSRAEDSESEEEEEDETDDTPAAAQPEPTRQRSEESNSKTVSFVKAVYKPPPGFEITSIAEKSTASEILKKSSLKGKQIWYFTAPSSIPISKIERMSITDADAGKAILQYDGSDYGFLQDSTGDVNYTQIMVPNSSDGAYLSVSKPIDRVLHLQQIVNLPGINDGDDSAVSSSRATVPAKKPVREQPKGLRMRFRPIGFGKGKLGKLGSGCSDSSSSDEEMEDAPKVFQRPELEDEDEEMDDAPPVIIKPKKSKSDSQAKSSPLKRKHVDDRPAKKSSSQPIAVIDNTPLKKLKKKQKESQSMTDSRSAATEHNESAIKPPSKTAKHASLTTPDLASSPIRPESSQSSSQKHSKKHSREAEKTPSRKDDLSLQELTKATDPNLTGEERRKKIKKLKHKVLQ